MQNAIGSSAVCPHNYLRPGLARPPHQPLVSREPLERDRAACVHAAGRDADLGTQPEFAAIGKLGRGVVHHDRGIDAVQEAVGGGLVLAAMYVVELLGRRPAEVSARDDPPAELLHHEV